MQLFLINLIFLQTSATVDKLIGTLDSAINITSSTIAFGEGEKVTRQKNLNVSIEKDSAEMFLNRSEIKRDGFILDLQNDTLENITATELELQVCELKRNVIGFCTLFYRHKKKFR